MSEGFLRNLARAPLSGPTEAASFDETARSSRRWRDTVAARTFDVRLARLLSHLVPDARRG